MQHARPSVDVVIPFAGSEAALDRLLESLRRLELQPDDTVVVVDNTAGAEARRPRSDERLRVLPATEQASSYYARNRGAAVGNAPWLLFLDADVAPPDDLLARYWAESIGDRTGVVAGGVADEDEAVDGHGTIAARYAFLTASQHQDNTLAGRFAYAQTSNCLVRRSAFEAIGGFTEGIRSGGDADLCFRLTEQGWALERREDATVAHLGRTTVRTLLRQRVRHGAGTAWLAARYPGFGPPSFGDPAWRRAAGLAKWTCASWAQAVRDVTRGDRDHALVAAIEPLTGVAFEIGQLLPNASPQPGQPGRRRRPP
jgi:GT2 family glycosyltransferase